MNGFWSQRNKRERMLIVLCLVAAVVAVPLALMPQGTSNRKLLSVAAARQRFRKLTTDKAQMESTIDRLKPQVERMAYRERPEELVPRVVRELQGYAKSSGVHLREIKPLRPRKAGLLVKVPLSVRFTTADFSKSVLSFLYRTEDPAGRLVVEKLNINAADQKTHTVEVDAQVALYTTGGATDLAL